MISSRIVDYSLTERGRLQAEQTAQYFESFKLDGVYASPLKRAIETAQIIARPHDLEVLVRENFREVYTGVLEEQPDSAETWREWGRVTAAWRNGQVELAFPGGENQIMVKDRMLAGLDEILAGRDDQAVVVVAHIGLLMSSISAICPHVDLDELLAVETQNCAITEVDIHREAGHWTGELVRWGDFSHLHGDAANFTPPLVYVE